MAVLGCVGFAILWTALGLIIFVRSGKTKDVTMLNDNKPVFANTDAASVEYTDPHASTNVLVGVDETVLAHFAPVLRSLTADTYVLGKKQLTGEENCLIITEKQIIGILIAPQDLKKYGQESAASELINVFPGGAESKNQGTAVFARDAIKETAAALLGNESLTQVVAGHYAIAIQRSDVQEVSYSKIFGFKFKTAIGTFRWSLGRPKESAAALETLKSLGLPIR